MVLFVTTHNFALLRHCAINIIYRIRSLRALWFPIVSLHIIKTPVSIEYVAIVTVTVMKASCQVA